MARLSDIIENFIKDMLDENGGEQLLIQRTELADPFRCAPSQINYVVTTRFTYDKGYVIYDSIGDSITYHNAVSLIKNLQNLELITEREAELMKMVVNDRTISSTKEPNKLRATLLKSMLMVVVS